MASTMVRVSIPKNTFVDLYDAAGITVGKQIIVDNQYEQDVHLLTVETAPASMVGQAYVTILDGEQMINDSGDVGAFAYSYNVDTSLNIITEV